MIHISALLAILLSTGATAGQELDRDTLAPLLKLIKPQEGESLWARIPWLLRVEEARRKAAAEGKPILVWSGGGASPLGGC